MEDLSEKDAERYLKKWRDEPENARLRFACLKENHAYRDFVFGNREKVLLDFNASPKKEDRHTVLETFMFKMKELFSINAPFFLYNTTGLSITDLMDILDPAKDLDEIKHIDLEKVWPWLFFYPGVIPVTMAIIEEDNSIVYINPLSEEIGKIEELMPYEQFIKVDYRKKKSDLMEQFSILLDRVGVITDFPDTSRFREEGWRHLRVWKMRRQRKGFREIARELNITPDDAKKSFYRAYELIEGRSYEVTDFRQDNKEIKKEEVRRTCATCPDKPFCDTLCPDVLAYVDQDRSSRREKSLTEGALDLSTLEEKYARPVRPSGAKPDA